MASSRNSKSKSSGLRILWIPGRRKHDRKGHYESTSKHVSYNVTPQKKNQMWSLGGSKAQRNLLESEPDTTLFDGPSVSGLSPLAACSVTAVAATSTKLRGEAAGGGGGGGNHMENNNPNSDAPTTPNSSSSTALLVSIPNSPEPTVTVTSTNNEANVMPAAKYSSPPTTTTVAEIIEPNRFALLSRDGNDEIDPYNLPTPPKSDTHWRDSHRLNASGDANSSIATITSSPSPNSEVKSSSEQSATSSPTKKKSSRGHHNGQGDVNSIESVSDTDRIPSQDLDWIDELIHEHNANELHRKPKHKKKKHHQSISVKELDQLDGLPVPGKNKTTKPGLEEKVVEDDDKLVKCLYFTLMCCECSIS